jgi:uncharacterized SAM-binding protein YcdF (DUF218 family)
MKLNRVRLLLILRLFLLIICPVICVMWITHNQWLPLLCSWLNVSGSPVKADFIVYMGGEENLRPTRAAQLYKEGYADRVIASGYYSLVPTGLKVLQDKGVPLQAILINDRATTTWDESQQILAILRKEGAKSALIVTSASHTRRASATFETNQNDQRIELIFIAADLSNQCDTWWNTAQGKFTLQYEYSRIIFYLFRYGVSSF